MNFKKIVRKLFFNRLRYFLSGLSLPFLIFGLLTGNFSFSLPAFVFFVPILISVIQDDEETDKLKADYGENKG